MRPVVIQELNPLKGLSFTGGAEEEHSLRALLHSHRAEIIRLQSLMLETLERVRALEQLITAKEAARHE